MPRAVGYQKSPNRRTFRSSHACFCLFRGVFLVARARTITISDATRPEMDFRCARSLPFVLLRSLFYCYFRNVHAFNRKQFFIYLWLDLMEIFGLFAQHTIFCHRSLAIAVRYTLYRVNAVAIYSAQQIQVSVVDS